eukprot:scaffold3300_cov97-Isochrysis_galbana.AAC.5
MIGRAPGEMVKGGGERGGNASLPGESKVSRRIRPLALLILNFFFSTAIQTSPATRASFDVSICSSCGHESSRCRCDHFHSSYLARAFTLKNTACGTLPVLDCTVIRRRPRRPPHPRPPHHPPRRPRSVR